MEANDNTRWVAERLSIISPRWTPDLIQARAALHGRLQPQPRRQAWIAAAALTGLTLFILALPQGRAFAQDLWFRLFLNRIDIVRIDLSDVPLQTKVMGSGKRNVVGLAEAESQSGLQPRLPAAESWLGAPTLSVIGAMTFEQTVRTSDLRNALAQAGASGVTVPNDWDQLTLRASLGPLVQAEYLGEIQILQTKPAQLFLPAGFPLPRFAETVFRSLGLSPSEARALARRYAAQPALLLGIPADEAAKIEEVSLSWGRGVLAEEFADNGQTARVTLVFNTKDRIYAVITPSRDTCLKVAELLPLR